jgi:hypothetical protein
LAVKPLFHFDETIVTTGFAGPRGRRTDKHHPAVDQIGERVADLIQQR